MPRLKQREMKILNRKIALLKSRIHTPEDKEGRNILRKLKEIIHITKDGVNHKKNGSLKNNLIFGSKTLEGIAEEESNLIDSYWNKLSENKKISKSVVDHIKNNRINLMIEKLDRYTLTENNFQLK